MSVSAQPAPVAPDAEAIWQEFHQGLLGFINRRVRSRETAEDILQEVMLRIHRQADGIERAEAVGARRRAGDPRLPLADSLIRRRGYWLTLVFGVILAAPAIAAVVLAGLRWAVAFAAWFATLWFGLDVLVLAAGIVMLWRGWLPPLDGGEGPEDPDPAPEPSDPFSRAHIYRLR